jgi:hypothetical protein
MPDISQQFTVSWFDTNFGGSPSGQYNDYLTVTNDEDGSNAVPPWSQSWPSLNPGGSTPTIIAPIPGLPPGNYHINIWVNYGASNSIPYPLGIIIFGPGGNSAVPNNHPNLPKVPPDLETVRTIASFRDNALNNVPGLSRPLPEPGKAALVEPLPALTYFGDGGPLPIHYSMPVRKAVNMSHVAALDKIFCDDEGRITAFVLLDQLDLGFLAPEL